MARRTSQNSPIENIYWRGVVGAILIRFLHTFVSTGSPFSHKIIQQCPFMQTAPALQNHG